jgi:hypothetical protein
MPPFFDMVGLFAGWPLWVGELIGSLAIGYTVCVFGVAFGKMGRSPYWGLVFVLPLLGTIMLWTFGLGRWPVAGGDKGTESGL